MRNAFVLRAGRGPAVLATSSLILVGGLAACVPTQSPGIHKVGATTSFTSQNSGTPHTAIPAGEHQVTLRYQPTMLFCLFALSLFACALLFFRAVR